MVLGIDGLGVETQLMILICLEPLRYLTASAGDSINRRGLILFGLRSISAFRAKF